jgi:hypothetical protein
VLDDSGGIETGDTSQEIDLFEATLNVRLSSAGHHFNRIQPR